MKKLFALTLIVLFACQPKTQSQSQTNQQPSGENPQTVGTIAESAMVSSTHPLASEVGFNILKKGGNAYDAAIAVQFALAVVYPRAGNIGGGGFAVIRKADGATDALDFREKAPSRASRDMYLDKKGDVIKGLSTIGHRASGVPGSVAGMWELHKKHGSLEWKTLIQPAISLAFEGFELTERGAKVLNENQDEFKEANTYKPWVIREEPWQMGEIIIQKELAGTLAFIRDQGRDGFYKGIVADQIVKEMARGNGIISKEDLENYQALWRTPIEGTYRGHKVIGMPPPSSGGIALLQLLHGADILNLSQEEFHSATHIHLMAEIEKRVYADRSKHLGDADFYDVPVKTLLSEEYLNERFKGIERKEATPSKEIAAGEIRAESNETTHFSVVDEEGNAIAITTTLNGNMGCNVMVKGAGFFLNNEMNDFSSKPGVPNMFGLIGSKANEIAPNKRMLSSMTPTIVEKDGQLKMILGTPGGATIITSVFQALLNVVDRDMSMQEAINHPRYHHQWLPERIYYEKGKMPEKLKRKLERMGHTTYARSPIGRMDCILIREDGKIEGASDPTRSDGVALGY